MKALKHDGPLIVIHYIHDGTHDQKLVFFVTL